MCQIHSSGKDGRDGIAMGDSKAKPGKIKGRSYRQTTGRKKRIGDGGKRRPLELSKKTTVPERGGK